MKLHIFYGCLLFLSINAHQAEQFIYPVADFDSGNQLAIIHQKSLDHVTLWFFNQDTQVVSQGLSSFLTPANFRIMPSQDGFSFIDQGYIKIKYFNKRSPETIEIYEPISLFSGMNWIDTSTFYFTAREGENYQIFQGGLHSNVKRLSNESIDFLYPTKIGDTFFCIKRSKDHHFKITMQPWLPINFSEYQILPETVIVPYTDTPLCFLKMVSDSQGFYLHAPTLRHNDSHGMYIFSCHHLTKTNDGWKTEELFKFALPLKYLQGPDRLYESIEPFLPNYTMKDYIYYIDFDIDTNSCKIMNFYIPEKKVIDLTLNLHTKNHDNKSVKLFAPYIIQSGNNLEQQDNVIQFFHGTIVEKNENDIAISEYLEKKLLLINTKM